MNQENTDNLSSNEIPSEIVISGEAENEAHSINEDASLSEINNDTTTEIIEEIQHIETNQISEKEDNINISQEKETFLLLKELSEKFDKKIAVDTHKNELFDKMYTELSSYKTDIYSKMLKPIIMDIIMCIDDMNKMFKGIEKDNVEKLLKTLNDIPDELLEILERNGVEAYYDEADIFNPKTQRVLKTILTEDPEQDNKIESRVRQGYKWGDKILKPEMIQCYKYSQNK